MHGTAKLQVQRKDLEIIRLRKLYVMMRREGARRARVRRDGVAGPAPALGGATTRCELGSHSPPTDMRPVIPILSPASVL
jgi:hypothetical protein